MKNTFKILGIAVLMAVMGFSLLSCDDGSGGTSTKYQATIYSLPNATFTATFTGQALPTAFRLLSGDNATLISQVFAGRSIAALSGGILTEDNGLSLSAVEKAVNDYLVPTYITASERDAMINELKSKGAGVAVVPISGTEIGIAAAVKE